jgi:hypothetical protein
MRGAILLVTSMLLPSCGGQDVVVSTLASNVGAGGVGDCSSNDDCLPSQFCSRQACSDTYGHCEERPLFCDDPMAPPTCDCDGVSYWNDCLRQQYGATSSSVGSCVTGVATCMDNNALDCPVLGAACAKLFQPGTTCDERALGACWVLPVECPMSGPPDRWSACSAPMDCRDTCGAIRTGQAYRHDLTQQCLGMDPFPGGGGR